MNIKALALIVAAIIFIVVLIARNNSLRHDAYRAYIKDTGNPKMLSEEEFHAYFKK